MRFFKKEVVLVIDTDKINPLVIEGPESEKCYSYQYT